MDMGKHPLILHCCLIPLISLLCYWISKYTFILSYQTTKRPLKIYNFADPLQPRSLAYIMLVGNDPLICIFNIYF